MNVLDLLRGQMISVKTDVGTEVLLEIAKVERNHHCQQTGPSNRENDWWPDAREWDTYIVHFTNGHKKEYESIEQINIIP